MKGGTLYELHGYRMNHYDRSSERKIRLKDCWSRPGRVEEWIASFLAKFPDGKVVVSIVEYPQRRRERIRKVRTATNV